MVSKVGHACWQVDLPISRPSLLQRRRQQQPHPSVLAFLAFKRCFTIFNCFHTTRSPICPGENGDKLLRRLLTFNWLCCLNDLFSRSDLESLYAKRHSPHIYFDTISLICTVFKLFCPAHMFSNTPRRSAIHPMFLLGVLPPYTTSRDWVWDQRVSQFQELLRILKLTRSAILLSSVGDP
jgi:hypothetical protein